MADGKPWRVFLVDDDEVVIQLLVRLIGSDYRFTTVGSASTLGEAIRVLPQARPDLILLDHLLPDALGAPGARALRAITPAARVVVFSAAAEEAGESLAGISDWISKGDIARLMDRLAESMSRNDAGAEASSSPGSIA